MVSLAADGTFNNGVVEANFNDVITGSAQADQINGLGGNDFMAGDLVYGNGNADTKIFKAANDSQ